MRGSPPARHLLLAGFCIGALGLFIFVGAVIGSLRDFDWTSLLALLFGGGVGALIAWLGLTALCWAGAAAWVTVEVDLGPEALRVRKRGWKSSDVEVRRLDFVGTVVTDELGLAHELLVTSRGPRLIRVLNGRSLAELRWLGNLIESQFPRPEERDVPEEGVDGDDTHDIWDESAEE